MELNWSRRSSAGAAMELSRSFNGDSPESSELRRGCNGAQPELQGAMPERQCCIGAPLVLLWSSAGVAMDLRRSVGAALELRAGLRWSCVESSLLPAVIQQPPSR